MYKQTPLAFISLRIHVKLEYFLRVEISDSMSFYLHCDQKSGILKIDRKFESKP